MSKSDDAKLRRQIRDAAPDAIAALHAICRDDTAPAPARATAAGWIVRAAGLDKNMGATDDDMEALSEAELEATIARLKEEAADIDRRREQAAAKEASNAAERPAATRKGRRKATSGLFD